MRRAGAPGKQDTMVLVYSSTKGVTAMCANRLAQEGRIDVDAPVATYWPEFAQVGKEGVTVADLLAHRAGLAWVDGSMTIEEALAWEPVIAALEQQAPSWPPGSAHGYHAITFGWLVGEVVRRVTGKSLGTYLREEIADPLGADFFIGLPQSQMARPARLISIVESMASKEFGSLGGASGSAPGPGLTEMAELAKTYMAPGGPLFKAIIAPGGAFADQGIWNDPALWAAEVPAANGITDARGLARLYGACVSDVETPAGAPFRAALTRAARPCAGATHAGSGQGPARSRHPVGARLHGEPGHRFRPRTRRTEGLRPLRDGGLGGMGRTRSRAGHGLRHEPHVGGDGGRHSQLPAHGGHRRGGATVDMSQIVAPT